MKLIFLDSFAHLNVTYPKAKATVIALEEKLDNWNKKFNGEIDKVKALCDELSSEDGNLDSSTIETHLKDIEYALLVVQTEINYKNRVLNGFHVQYSDFSSAVMANPSQFRESEQELAEKLAFVENKFPSMNSRLAIMTSVFENLRVRVKAVVERKCLQSIAPLLVADQLPDMSKSNNN